MSAGRAGATVADIVRVRSHPQALAQCERYLKTRGWQAIPAYDTAGAASELAASPEPGAAAIASALAGQIYGLRCWTRASRTQPTTPPVSSCWAARSRRPASATRPRSSSPPCTTRCAPQRPGRACQPRHQPDQDRKPSAAQPALALRVLRGSGRSLAGASVHRALIGLLARTAFIKLLGSYPAAE